MFNQIISAGYMKVRYAWLTVPELTFIDKNISMQDFAELLLLEELGEVAISGSYFEL